jgi:hypothetical protein
VPLHENQTAQWQIGTFPNHEQIEPHWSINIKASWFFKLKLASRYKHNAPPPPVHPSQYRPTERRSSSVPIRDQVNPSMNTWLTFKERFYLESWLNWLRRARDPIIANTAREVRISPDTGDGNRKASAGRDGQCGGETEDPAEEGIRASHPAGGNGEAESRRRMGRSGRTESGGFRPCRRGRPVLAAELKFEIRKGPNWKCNMDFF